METEDNRLANIALSKLDTHEQICSLRYKRLEEELSRVLTTIKENREEDKEHIHEVFMANREAIQDSKNSIDEIKGWFKWTITSLLGAGGTVAFAILFKGIL